MTPENITDWTDYELIDSGGARRLERFGIYILDRPAPQALWPRSQPDSVWKRAHAVYHRSSSGGGNWQMIQTIPESWSIQWEKLTLRIKPTGFGHVGIFPEQADHWKWIMDQASMAKTPIRILNLFAYTGVASLAAAQVGSQVCHVDGSRGVVTWGNENAALSDLAKAPIRWIVDDVIQFANREVRRGVTYHGIILDPPSFGRGPKGQVWKLEKQLPVLLDLFRNLLDKHPCFLLFTCHSQHISATGLENLLIPIFQHQPGVMESGDCVIRPRRGGVGLPSGIFARWRRTS